MLTNYMWLIIAAILIVIELNSGTFYLLMLSIASIAAWLAQQLGASFLIQGFVFFITSGLLVKVVHNYRRKRQLTEPKNQASNLDTGAIITVYDWQNAIGNTKYRGAHWQVVLNDISDIETDGAYQIIEIDSNRLSVRSIPSTH